MAEKNKKGFSDAPELTLKNLIDVEEWQKIQDNFATITDVGVRIVDARGTSITTPSRNPRFCRELLKNPIGRHKICGLCLPTFLGGKKVVNKNLSFICHAGLYNFIAPLSLNKDKVLGYIIVGPIVLIMRKSKEEYRRLAEELNLDLEELWGAILEIKVLSFNGAQSLVALVKDLIEYTLNLAYQNIIQEKKITKPLEIKLPQLLNTLLEVAFEISGADIGSIMSLDRVRNQLRIQSAKGIASDIVRNSRVELGRGIAGIAAKRGEALLINDQTKDNRLRPYLNRPAISSSMVIPLKIEQDVIGVMNLGTLTASPTRFDSHNLKLMNKLVNLVTVALNS